MANHRINPAVGDAEERRARVREARRASALRQQAEKVAAVVPAGHELLPCEPLVVPLSALNKRHHWRDLVAAFGVPAPVSLAGVVVAASAYTCVHRYGRSLPHMTHVSAWGACRFDLQDGDVLELSSSGARTAKLFPYVKSPGWSAPPLPAPVLDANGLPSTELPPVPLPRSGEAEGPPLNHRRP